MTLFSNSRQEDLKTVLIHMYYVCQYTNNYPAFWWKKTYPFTCICLTLPWKSHNKMASPTLISPRLSGVKATCWMWSEWPIKTYLKNRKKDFWLWFPVEVGMIQRSWNMQTFLYDESRFPFPLPIKDLFFIPWWQGKVLNTQDFNPIPKF